MIALACVAAQSLLTLQLPADVPVRFGVPLPARRLERGLSLRGAPGAVLQWRPLSLDAAADPERIWVEIAVLGGSGRARLVAGGQGPSPRGTPGPCYTERVETRERPADATADTTSEGGEGALGDRPTLHVHTREWRDGRVDRLEVVEHPNGTRVVTTVDGWLEPALAVPLATDHVQRAGFLPAGHEAVGREWFDRLTALVPAVERTRCEGPEGRGDHRRGDVVTNNEFDTPLAWLRLGLGSRNGDALRAAWHGARHTAGVDRDRRSGLPHRHGADHRRVAPEVGHVWIDGMLQVGLWFADDTLLDAARDTARALAERMRHREARGGPFDRLRDEAWPLHELERHLRFEHTAPVAAAADAIATRMLDRRDPASGVLRYGENETRSGVVRDRVWQTIGIALPALRLHVDRTGRHRSAVDALTDALETRWLDLWRDSGEGLPIGYAVGEHGVFGPTWRAGTAEAFLLLDGLRPRARQRVLRRATTRDALLAAFDADADDVATRFTLIGRCDWIWRQR